MERDENTRSLAAVAEVFNRHRVEYLVSGAHACALQGHIRATEDFDLLIRNTPTNLEHTVAALEELFPELPEPILARDIIDNVVLKISDDIEVDVAIQAWDVRYEDALADRSVKEIDGVSIPYMGIDSLIRSKTTPREIDQWDIAVLREIKRRRQS